MNDDEKFREYVCGSAKRALTGQTPGALRAYSFFIDNEKRRIFLRAHFETEPSEDDLDSISVVETEIDADLVGGFEGETDIEVVPLGVIPTFLPSGIAYLREGEAGTLCDG